MKKLLKQIKAKYFTKSKDLSHIEYWEERSKKFGAKAVLNLAIKDKDERQLLELQKKEIFPYLKKKLRNTEKLLLDFGCGPGRFSTELASFLSIKVVGVDPIKTLLDLAPTKENVEYKPILNGQIPVENHSVDILWICLVLGGISDEDMLSVKNEFKRVLKPDGIICLIENTSKTVKVKHWQGRTEEEYLAIFDFASLEKVNSYFELDNEISVFTGYKKND